MLVGEILERLKEQNMKEICGELGLAPSTVQRKLKKLGYEWDNSAKVWLWEHDEEQPLGLNLLEMVKKPSAEKPKRTGKGKANMIDPNTENNQENENEAEIEVAADNDEFNLEIFDSFINPKNKNKSKIQRGFWFEPDVIKALDKHIPIKHKSNFVNEAVKLILKSKGLLK